MSKLTDLPENLPIPEDDGGADNLLGISMPSIELLATDGSRVNLAKLEGITVVFCYPMTGRPDVALPDNWEMIPGARGCTPQSCAFRDLYQAFQELGASVFGLSVQPTDYQAEAVERLHLPYPMLSDVEFKMTEALTLPTMEVAGMRLIKRTTLVVQDGQIVKLFYPVFPPNENAQDVLDWLEGKG